MSEVFARLRVKEVHGIRRFLYPLDATVRLPATVEPDRLRLLTAGGQAVPFQALRDGSWEPGGDDRPIRYGCAVSFCVSLAPHEEATLTLTDDGPRAEIADPLQLTLEEGGLWSRQKQFSAAVTSEATLTEVVYDGVAHLRGPATVTRNGETPNFDPPTTRGRSPIAPLHTWVSAEGHYADGCPTRRMVHLVSCKSMIGLLYSQEDSLPGDEIVFTLPLVVAGPTLLCDFGVGGGTYGRLQPGVAEEITWRTDFEYGKFVDDGPAHWSLSTAGRTDYVGTATAAEFPAQRWFHLVDGGKALAVAIHHTPLACRMMQVTLRVDGMVTLAFTLNETWDGPAEVSLTYHFLNGVPAIAAATNPQSLLLPPTVEVLGA